MATKTTSQTLDEKQLEIYHSFLILAERRILLAAKNDSTTINSVLEDIQKDLTKNKDIKSLPKSFKETLTKTIKTAAIISKNCQPPSPYMALNIMRNNRKKFDSEYIKNLIYSTTNPTDEKISQIKAFFQQVKEDDPLYLDKLIATTLEHFKSIPSSFKYKKDDATQRYTVSQEHKTMILNAQRIINQVVTGYKINTKEFVK